MSPIDGAGDQRDGIPRTSGACLSVVSVLSSLFARPWLVRHAAASPACPVHTQTPLGAPSRIAPLEGGDGDLACRQATYYRAFFFLFPALLAGQGSVCRKAGGEESHDLVMPVRSESTLHASPSARMDMISQGTCREM